MKVTSEPAGLLDIAPFTVADGRSALLIAARSGAAGPTWLALLLASRPDADVAECDLFKKLQTAVGWLASVTLGETPPGEVLAETFTDAELADGTALLAAISRCEQDVHELLVELVPDKPPAVNLGATRRVPEADSPFWSES